MLYRLLFIGAILMGCGDGVIVKMSSTTPNRGVLTLNCMSVAGLVSHQERVIAACRRIGLNEYILPVGSYMLRIYAAGYYTQYAEVEIKSMEATKLRIELLKEPPR